MFSLKKKSTLYKEPRDANAQQLRNVVWFKKKKTTQFSKTLFCRKNKSFQ